MSPLSWPVLGGAALLSSPALYRAFVLGTTSTDVALTRFLVTLAVWWAVLAFVAMLIGPAPRPERMLADDQVVDEAEAPASA